MVTRSLLFQAWRKRFSHITSQNPTTSLRSTMLMLNKLKAREAKLPGHWYPADSVRFRLNPFDSTHKGRERRSDRESEQTK